MNTSNWRVRVLLEPRGFIKVIEFILSIVAFATTGGYSSQGEASLKCGTLTRQFKYPVTYPFNLESNAFAVPHCNSSYTGFNVTDSSITLDGDFSPTSQWFMFVAVMAFLLSLAAIVFYVVFEADVRQNNERMVTMADFTITILWTFLWLTAASSWAWGLGQVKTYTGQGAIFTAGTLEQDCPPVETTCYLIKSPDFSPLNASVAFAFLSFFVWAGNVWFVYKETPLHDDQQNLTPNEGGPTQQVPSNQT